MAAHFPENFLILGGSYKNRRHHRLCRKKEQVLQ
jgi:hypothetical protein